MDLKAIYLTALARCAPETLVRAFVREDLPAVVVAIGKCAAGLLDGVASLHSVTSAFAAIPEGYPLPKTSAQVHIGGHPQMTAASFAAGRALLEFVDAHDDILFLISGGSSACVEVALPPFTEGEVARANARLVASGMPIAEINRERRAMSAIKGGRLAARVRRRAVTFVYSDVSSGQVQDVGSGPTIPGSETVLVADNRTLVQAAANLIGGGAVVMEQQIESDVREAAALLAARASTLQRGQVLVAGGEPTVVVKGDGRGGRCSELAARFAMLSGCEALFGGSDGVDGNSGAAGFYLPRRSKPATPADAEEALARSDSFSIAAQVGEPIMISPTGNNLRDLFLVACV